MMEFTGLLLALTAGVVASLLAVKYLLPRVAEHVGNFFYSSGERIGHVDSDEAAALMARGDFQGALRVFEARLVANPRDLMSIKEIARLQSEHLDDPEGAIAFLDRQANNHAWSADDRAYLRFRKVDVYERGMEDFDQAREELEGILLGFPSTRHAANARHRLAAYPRLSHDNHDPEDGLE
jgi:tetratricopeptide (TPR) repeat protein